MLAPAVLAKLRARLTDLANAEHGQDPAAQQRAADEAALAGFRRKLPTVTENMALAGNPDERAAMAAVFNDLKAQERRLEERLRQAPVAHDGGPEEQVGRALSALDRLAGWAGAEADDYPAVEKLVCATGAKLYLRFREERTGRRVKNVPAGGVLTFGSAPPPGPLYEGPADKAAVRQKLAAGESLSRSWVRCPGTF